MQVRGKRFLRLVAIAIVLGGLVVGVRLLVPVRLPEYDRDWSHVPWEYAVTVLDGTNLMQLARAANADAPPMLAAPDVTDMPASFVADPFIYHTNDLWYLFAEVYNAATRQGDISVATSQDGTSWKYVGTVLDEPYHLSYPCVFQWQGRSYMIPEGYRSGWVKLYTTDSFPVGWTPVADLIRGEFVDSTPFRYDGRWWIFCGVRHNADLHLYSSDKLESGWQAHPKSPVVWGNADIARPGGRTFVDDSGRLIRVTQDCDPYYGNQVRAFHITSLTTNDYAETELAESPLLDGEIFSWASSGMHHFAPERMQGTNAPGGWLVAVDGFAPASPDVPLDIHYANGMMLGGVSMWPKRARPGGHLLVRFFWKGVPDEAAMTEPCSAFVHFKRASRIVFQGDYTILPSVDYYEMAVPIPDDTPPGSYAVRVGLYNALNGRRMRVLQPRVTKRGEVELPITIVVDASDKE